MQKKCYQTYPADRFVIVGQPDVIYMKLGKVLKENSDRYPKTFLEEYNAIIIGHPDKKMIGTFILLPAHLEIQEVRS